MDNVKVYCYCRVSKAEQESLPQQHEAIVGSYPAGTDFVWLDEKLSGWKGDRPEYNHLLKCIEKNWVKDLCVYSVSRLGRNAQEASRLMTLCQKRNVRVKVVAENLDFSGPMGLALWTLFAALAQMDSDMKSLRTKASLDWKRAGGWRCHGSPPYCVAQKVKDKAEEIYHMRDSGKSSKYIAKMLALHEHTVSKVLKLRGYPLLTRAQFAQLFPGWHTRQPADMPSLDDIRRAYRQASRT